RGVGGDLARTDSAWSVAAARRSLGPAAVSSLAASDRRRRAERELLPPVFAADRARRATSRGVGGIRFGIGRRAAPAGMSPDRRRGAQGLAPATGAANLAAVARFHALDAVGRSDAGSVALGDDDAGRRLPTASPIADRFVPHVGSVDPDDGAGRRSRR